MVADLAQLRPPETEATGEDEDGGIEQVGRGGSDIVELEFHTGLERHIHGERHAEREGEGGGEELFVQHALRTRFDRVGIVTPVEELRTKEIVWPFCGFTGEMSRFGPNDVRGC